MEDIIGGDEAARLQQAVYARDSHAPPPLSFLSPGEKLALNQIRANGYLSMSRCARGSDFALHPDYAKSQPGQMIIARAPFEFAGEEAKHIHLFRRFREEFEQGFGSTCAVIGPAAELAPAILSHHPLAVALTVLQGEWMTQRHYLDSVKDDQQLDPQSKACSSITGWRKRNT